MTTPSRTSFLLRLSPQLIHTKLRRQHLTPTPCRSGHKPPRQPLRPQALTTPIRSSETASAPKDAPSAIRTATTSASATLLKNTSAPAALLFAAGASTYPTVNQYPTMAPDTAFKRESTPGLPADPPAPQQPHQASPHQHAICCSMPPSSPPVASRRLLIHIPFR